MRSPAVVLILVALNAILAVVLIAAAREVDQRPGATGRAPDAGAGRAAEPDPRAERAERRSPRHDRRAQPERRPRIEWRDSVAIGSPGAGSLARGVQLPAEGRHFFTWDPIRRTQPNRGWRRWGTDALVRTLLRVVRAYGRDHPGAPRVGIGDLSRPHGGNFGPQFGGIGHATHQNGLDADVYYPLRDEAERAPLSAAEIDPALSQDLVDRFVAAGAETIYVGPNTGLTGPAGLVVPLANHDNHLHVRMAGG